MSDQDGSDGRVALIIIGLFLAIAMAYYVNWNQAEAIRDLQRRVGQLEVRDQVKPNFHPDD